MMCLIAQPKPFLNALLAVFLVLSIPCSFCKASVNPVNQVRIYPNPKGEPLSSAYRVYASGRAVPVYMAKVGATDNSRRFKAVDDLMHSADYFDNAAFCYFDLSGSTTITVTVSGVIKSARVLPSSAVIIPKINTHSISFKVSSPKNLTVEINGEQVKSLHIFVNPIERVVPKATDPNVIYFGPGVHEVSSLVVGSNKTVYIAGGAIVKAVIGKTEQFGIEPSGLKNYPQTFILAGNNIKFCGRGILDASAIPTHGKNFVDLQGNNITLEGVILVNSSTWTVPIRQSSNILIDNIKILGYRANSDGIDICNSRNVTIQNCFIRTNDDLIVIKSWENGSPVDHVVVKNCVLWNQLAHALSIGAELREDVNDVLFTNCEIIHDTSREWSLRVFQSDASLVSNIRFENINIEESHQFVSLWTGKVVNSLDKTLGDIKNVTFKNIRVSGSPLSIELIGGSADHGIKGVTFNNVKLNGKKLSASAIRSNPFVKDVVIAP
jgi:hypothetical protein